MRIEYDRTNPYNAPGTDLGTIYLDDLYLDDYGRRLFLLDAPNAVNVGAHGDVEYVASAADSDGHICTVVWQTLPGWDGEDEEHACDWDEFEIIFE